MPRSLPLQLSDADVRPHWEGQPRATVVEYALHARVGDRWVDVRMWFGTREPSRVLDAAAQAELDRLVIPDASVFEDTGRAQVSVS